MTIANTIAALTSRASPTRRTVRFRLTVLYEGLFLACGAALLAITYGLVADQSVKGSLVPSSTSSATSQVKPPATTAGTGAQPNRGGGASAASGGAVPPAGTHIHPISSQAHFDINIGQSATMHHLLVESGIALAVMAVVAVGLGWLVAGRVLRPLRSMTRTARHITQDNLHQRLALSGPDDELKDLGDTIDGLLGRLESAFDGQRRFVANISHELRTPLATMRSAVDVAVAKPLPAPPGTIALAEKMHKGLDQIDRLLESLLALSRFQLGAATQLTTLPLTRIVDASIRAHAAAITDRNLKVETSCSGDSTIEGDDTLIARMVDNLIDNAIRHNQPGGWIHAATDRQGNLVRLTVETGGVILDQRGVEALAHPFRRLGTERTGTDNGSGLGLSIVAAIAQAHRGSLKLHARAEGGLRATISLPAANQLAVTGAST
jgi:signal transduction histidine kinase